LRHHLNAPVVFREGDDITDAILAGDEHDEAVEAEGDAAMRRGAEFERLQDVPEEELLFLLVDSEDTEHFRPQVGFVDSQATAADFHAVQHYIVGHGANLAVFTGLEERNVLGARAGEGMMDGVPFLLLLAPSEQRKINDPEEIESGRTFKRVEHFGHAQADAPEGFAGGFPLVGSEQNEVAFLDGKALGEGCLFGFGEKFDDR
jgi:hypothetical protein